MVAAFFQGFNKSSIVGVPLPEIGSPVFCEILSQRFPLREALAASTTAVDCKFRKVVLQP